jgi:hypothetical protein
VRGLYHDLVPLSKVLAVSLAVGLDVLALSVGVGVARLSLAASFRVGTAFATSEIAMQLIGYKLGARASQMLGEIADDISLTLLLLIGCLMIVKSFEYLPEAQLDTAKGRDFCWPHCRWRLHLNWTRLWRPSGQRYERDAGASGGRNAGAIGRLIGARTAGLSRVQGGAAEVAHLL